MEHADFTVGREFWTETGCWRCTDVGTRTEYAIKLEGSWNIGLDRKRTSMVSGIDKYNALEGMRNIRHDCGLKYVAVNWFHAVVDVI